MGSTGNDLITLSTAVPKAYDGGSGLDTAAIAVARDSVALTKVGDAWQIKDVASGSVNVLTNVERLAFADVSVALDTNGVAAQAFRLYQAAFDRAPDLSGLGYYIDKLDGGTTLASIAHNFMASQEFISLMGTANPTDAAFVTALYQNVLHRAPDAQGSQYWLDELHAGTARENVLVRFSESPENQTALADVIGHGMEYVPVAQPVMAGTAGNDRQVLSMVAQGAYDGGSGRDTAVVAAAHDNVELTKVAGVWQIRDAATGAVSSLSNVERVVFSDATVALDTDGVAGQAFRLYQAAFDRAPDQSGLGFYIDKLDHGVSLATVAHNFIVSPEFAQLMGTATPSDEALVTALYQNVLHRAPDAQGYQYWLDQLHAGTSREGMLVGFSESPENQAALVGVMQHGIEFIPVA